MESAIADNAGLLQLESRRTGIRRPFKVFRQLSLPTPSDRVIFPDVVLLAASGHVIVVEVKLGSNPELKNRSVIAQIVDYAASFSSLDNRALIAMFDTLKTGKAWDELVAAWFPEEHDVDELANALEKRMNAGEINLVIACDKVPIGLPDVISGIVSVRPLGFELDLVEITPFVDEQSEEIILVPSTQLQTEIVARTAVTVRYQAGQDKPAVEVESSSASSIIDKIKGVSDARRWSIDEVETAVEEDGTEIEKKLFRFAKEQSVGGQCVSPAQKKIPTFGLTYSFNVNGKLDKKMVFYCTLGWNGPTLNLGNLKSYASPNVDDEFRRRLEDIFGANVNTKSPMPGIPYEYLEPKISEFFVLFQWLKEQLAV